MYLTCELTGHLFGPNQSNVSRNITYLEPAVIKSFPISAKLYVDSKNINDIIQLQRFFLVLIVMTDGIELQIPRSKNHTKRKIHYSEKKKDTQSKIKSQSI